jgi:hypothetical protein
MQWRESNRSEGSTYARDDGTHFGEIVREMFLCVLLFVLLSYRLTTVVMLWGMFSRMERRKSGESDQRRRQRVYMDFFPRYDNVEFLERSKHRRLCCIPT